MLKRRSTVVFGIHCYPMWGQREVSKISHLGFLGFDFKHNPKVHFEGKMANFYNLGSMFCCSLTIVTLGYCVLLAIEQCFDVKQMADVKLLTQGQARRKLSQRYVEAPIAICNVSQH